jgi:Tfp pilus assembly protein PilP
MRAARIVPSIAIVVLAVAAVLAQPKTRPGARPGGARAATATTVSTTASTTATTGSSSVQQSLQEILEEPTTGDNYRYDPQGRRDPFQSLIAAGPRLDAGKRPPGVPGFLIDEVKLSGIVRTRGGLVGMIQGPDNKGYVVRVNEKLLDGEVIRITPTSLVFRQEVNDPTRIERYREVVRDLAPDATKR